jgi:hypothetical protein
MLNAVTTSDWAHLDDLTGLQLLALGGTQVTDAKLDHLKGMLGLQTLLLTNSAVMGAGLASLKDLPQLQSLILSGNAMMSDAGLAPLKNLKNLRALNLDDTAVTDGGLLNLKDLRELRELDIESTAVTDAGLVYLKELKKLQVLNLATTHMTGAGLVNLTGARELRRLYLTGPMALADAGLASLHAALPQCEIYIYHGMLYGAPGYRDALAAARAEASVPAKPSNAVSAALSRHLPEVDFDGIALSAELDFVRDVGGLSIIVDWKALETLGIKRTAPGTAHLKNAEFRDVLSAILTQASTPTGHPAFAGVADAVVISSPKGLQRIQRDTQAVLELSAVHRDSRLAQRLPEITFDNVAISDVMDFLRDVSGANIVVNWKFLESVGIKKSTPVSFKARNITIGQALVSILDTSDPAVDFQVGCDHNIITIATSRKAGKN